LQHGNRKSKLVLAVIASLVIFGLSENAHAMIPVVVSAQITGPNTITVTYDMTVPSTSKLSLVDVRVEPIAVFAFWAVEKPMLRTTKDKAAATSTNAIIIIVASNPMRPLWL